MKLRRLKTLFNRKTHLHFLVEVITLYSIESVILFNSYVFLFVNSFIYYSLRKFFALYLIRMLHFIAIVWGVWCFRQVVLLRFHGDNIWYLISLSTHKPVDALFFLYIAYILIIPFLDEFMELEGPRRCDHLMSLMKIIRENANELLIMS